AGVAWLVLAPRGWRWPAAALLGAAWALASASWLAAHQLPAGAGEVDARLAGRIVGIPEVEDDHTAFELRPQRVLDGSLPRPLPHRIRLRWYGDAPALRPGERWHLSLRLQPPDGFLNPAGFDYQRWLFRHRIGATGYVREPGAAERAGQAATVDTLREAIAARMGEVLPESPRLGLLQALGVGIRTGISSAQWQTLSTTGTAHLLAISGLHIGLVAGAAGTALGGLWRCLPPLVRRVPALTAGTLAGGMAATGYATLAGFTLPTQRALVTVLVFAGALLLRRPLSPWHSLAVAAAAVLILDPWAPLGAGFWLSFGAVAVILAATTGRAAVRGLAPWLRIQALVGVGLLPATALHFGHLPVLSPLANPLAVPWVSVLVVPPVLTGIAALPLSEALAGTLWQVADWSLQALLTVLTAMAEQWGALEVPAPSAAQALLAGLGAALMLAPRGVPGRLLAPLLLGLLLLGPAVRPGDAARVVVFDTGAGLTALITDGERAVVYGGGPGGGLDAVSVAVAPYLEARGLELTAWVVPRAEAPWDGAVEHARERWPGATWVGHQRDGSWSTALGPLHLETADGGSGGLALRVSDRRDGAALVLQPVLPAEPAVPQVGARGCKDADKACSAAVATPRRGVLRTAAYGAITITRQAGRWQAETQWQHRGRIYHQPPHPVRAGSP
ncbi:MAG: ComEC/Rec2 family competence protein, partial [Halorhodospira sp.]